MEASGGRRPRVCVYSRDEREAAGNYPVGLFLFHPSAGGQSLDATDERCWNRRRVRGYVWKD